MSRWSRRSVGTALVAVLVPGCLGVLGEDSCIPLEDGSAPPATGGKDIDDLGVVNERSDDVTVRLAVEGPEERRCTVITLRPDEHETYEHVFANGVEYTVGVRVDGRPFLRGSHDWHAEALDNRGVLVAVGDDVSFQEYQH